MPKHDPVHFDQYTSQNRAKHQILTAYLPAYLTALKNKVDRFHYIDGFAGRGAYEGNFRGSPLLALETIAGLGLADRSTLSLVENIKSFYDEMVEVMQTHRRTPELWKPPLIKHGEFGAHVDEILGAERYPPALKVATFAFIDPCGVEGVKMKDLCRILRLDYGEVLLFFNYDAVIRLVGGVRKGTHDSQILAQLFGSDSAVQELIETFNRDGDHGQQIRDMFIRALRASSGARFFVPFRFDARSQKRTSHYLVHCCNNPLGFKIMKHVMWETGRDETDAYGKLEFLNDKERGSQFQLFRPDISDQKERILVELKSQPRRVNHFSRNWMNRPSDPFSERVYKMMILELESAGKVIVLDKKREHPWPSSKRKRKEQVTLADDLWIQVE